MDKKAIVILSGGLDSSTTSYIAKERGYELYALSFLYGQKHAKELMCAKKIANVAGVIDYIILDVTALQNIGGSALLQGSDIEIPSSREEVEIGKGIPATYVPFRNGVFLALAGSLADKLEINTIFGGWNIVDYSGYPDCRPRFLNAMEEALNSGTALGSRGIAFHIQAPLLHLTKLQIIAEAIRLKVPLEYTWSCYKGGEKACGVCDSCILRLKGFEALSIKDPIEYE